MKKAKLILIILVLIFSSSLYIFGNDYQVSGKYQMIVDGHEGDGGIFYRFDFNKDGTVKIYKQTGGKSTINEVKNGLSSRKKDFYIFTRLIVIKSLNLMVLL